MNVQVIRADLDNDKHAEDVLFLLNHYAAHPMGQGRGLDDDVRQRLIPGLQAHPTTIALLAYADDAPVGIALCFLGYSSFKGAPLLNIHDFAVHQSARGAGVGKKLMQAVCNTASDLDCCRVTLEVAVANEPARQLYLKCGFQPGDPDSTAQWFWTKPLT